MHNLQGEIEKVGKIVEEFVERYDGSKPTLVATKDNGKWIVLYYKISWSWKSYNRITSRLKMLKGMIAREINKPLFVKAAGKKGKFEEFVDGKIVEANFVVGWLK